MKAFPIPAALDFVPGAAALDLIDFIIPNPAPGALPAVQALDGGFRWALLWCTFSFQTNLTVSNRLLGVGFGTASVVRQVIFPATQFVVAGTSVDVTACTFSGNPPAATSVTAIPIAIFPITGPVQFRVLCGNIQAADQFTNVAGQFCRWTI